MIHADIVSGQYQYWSVLNTAMSVSFQKLKSCIGTPLKTVARNELAEVWMLFFLCQTELFQHL